MNWFVAHQHNSTCGATKEVAELNLSDQLMQFLMGLNEAYDHVRNQILVMDPLPNLSKPYSMILRIEKQKEVNPGSSSTTQNMAMKASKKFGAQINFQKRKNPTEKRAQVCEECGKIGHLKEVCVEIYGYPDRCKTLVEQRRKDGASSSRAFSIVEPEDSVPNAIDEQAVPEIIKAELQRYSREMELETHVSTIEDYDESSSKSLGNSILDNWSFATSIIDSGVTTHV
ncbi:UNVERIFIED_CONTAM: hypothetical protein Slati_2430600 [Sesamum latifolium]|uniref:CCHC-type domain-containing protein n=1 Tax=Sesamum latifolium TaxID=2727402 RepID=A0AAW2WDY2_9LAMI